jgi:hypothetical protein
VCLPASSALRPLFVRLFPSVPCCRHSSANAPDALRPPLVCFFLSACAGKLSSALRRDVSRRSLLALPCERRVIRTRGVMVTCPGARYQPRLLQWVNPSLESLCCNRGVVWIFHPGLYAGTTIAVAREIVYRLWLSVKGGSYIMIFLRYVDYCFRLLGCTRRSSVRHAGFNVNLHNPQTTHPHRRPVVSRPSNPSSTTYGVPRFSG